MQLSNRLLSLPLSFSRLFVRVHTCTILFFLVVVVEWMPSNKNELMLLLQPHILIRGSCNANSKKKGKEEKKEKNRERKERQNEEREIQQLTQQENYVRRTNAAGIALQTRMSGPLPLHNKNDDMHTIERRRRNTLRFFRSANRTKGA